MRLFHPFGGAMVLATLAAAVPAQLSTSNVCGAQKTVYITVPGDITSTVTAHSTVHQTVHVTSTVSFSGIGLPTSTSTKYGTVFVTETEDADTVTVTLPAPSVPVVTSTIIEYTTVPYAPNAASSSTSMPPTFVVHNGTTIWVDGVTPTGGASGTYVILTSSVTVMPLSTMPSHTKSTRTSTFLSTILVTEGSTITETLGGKSTSIIGTSAISISASSSLSSNGWIGWNATTTSGFSAGTGVSASGAVYVPMNSSSYGTASYTTFNTNSSVNPPHATLNSSLIPSISFVPSEASHTSLEFPTFSPSSSADGVSWVRPTQTSRSSVPMASATGGTEMSLSTSSALGVFSSLPSLSMSAFATLYSVSSTPSPAIGGSAVSSQLPNSWIPMAADNSFSATLTILNITASATIQITTVASLTTALLYNSSTLATAISSSSVESPMSSSYASPIAAPTSFSCGEQGAFTLDFDDIPPLSIGNQSVDTVQPQPVFSPYHQFDFSDGFTVVPSPTDPYLPSSGNQLVEFIPNFNLNSSNSFSGPNAGEFGYSGDIGNGDHGATGCFSFNVYGASLGCDSRGPACQFTFTGFKNDRTNGAAYKALPITTQKINVPACPALNNCTLTPVSLDNTFRELDEIRINVTVASAASYSTKMWWMDDLSMDWFNNSCATGKCRAMTHTH